ncbi:MAG: hypothetical protein P8046_01620, partial [Anaerolineales bacterium]
AGGKLQLDEVVFLLDVYGVMVAGRTGITSHAAVHQFAGWLEFRGGFFESWFAVQFQPGEIAEKTFAGVAIVVREPGYCVV